MTHRFERNELSLDGFFLIKISKHEGDKNPDDRNAGEKHKDRFLG
jgi:hypothetical protein